jgi:N-acetylneuraminic acid mutarotase
MSVLTPKRVVLFAAAVLLGATAFANNPSPRTGARMAFDAKEGVGVLFGGRGPFDGATQLVHDSDETWFWIGSRWVQTFPLDHPAARNSQSMVYDTHRQRVLLFGGRYEAAVYQGNAAVYNDTWAWQDGNWAPLGPAAAPPSRYSAGIAYDSDRDRVVLFGGSIVDSLGAPKPIYDTWEFDGTNWARVGADGQPTVAKPVLAYDTERKETIMMGIDGTSFAGVMYRYDSDAKTWSKITPQTMPPCVNEGDMVFQPGNKTLFWMGGICTTGTSPLEEVYEWDGTNWTKVTTSNANIRAYAQAVAYDSERENVVVYGGSNLGATDVRSDVSTYARGTWRFPGAIVRPFPRSLGGFQTDTANETVWLFGGLSELSNGFLDDLWGYRGQQWFPVTVFDGPGDCSTPLTAFDSDRGKLVLTCSGSTVFEWDGGAFTWKSFTLSKPPSTRQFAKMVYDGKLKKTVMFGGYSANGSYLNETWTWDGTNFTQVRTKSADAPNNRGLMAMWYDSNLEKTIVYGGIGRANLNESITRYSDMWSFDGTKWTKLSVTQTPGQRLGAQLAVDPASGKLLLFGGLLAEDAGDHSLTQTYVNDTWQWDGKTSAWTRLSPARSPDPRENGMMSWDPRTNEIVLFGGYTLGFYHSDLWSWDGRTWRPLVDQGVRRRASAVTPPPAPPATHD